MHLSSIDANLLVVLHALLETRSVTQAARRLGLSPSATSHALGRAREVTDRKEKLRAMERVVEHVVPGRWADARQPSEGELKGTTILAVSLDEASAKLRTGGPSDDEADLDLPVWAGVIPLALVPAAPAADNDELVPSYAERYRRPNGSATLDAE